MSTNTIFGAVLSIVFLNKKLQWFEWTGMLCILVGVVLAALAQKLDQHDESASVSGHFVLGIIFLLVANFANSVEAITAEFILKDQRISFFQTVGGMGVWGMLAYAIIVIPVTNTDFSGDHPAPPVVPLPNSSSPPNDASGLEFLYHEDWYDSLVQISNNNVLLALVLLNFLVLVVINVCYFQIMVSGSALTALVLVQLRAVCVWAFDLAAYYISGGKGSLGSAEKWTKWSWVQLIGFVAITFGALLFNETICVGASQEEGEDGDTAEFAGIDDYVEGGGGGYDKLDGAEDVM